MIHRNNPILIERAAIAAGTLVLALALLAAVKSPLFVGRQPDGTILNPQGQRLDPVGGRFEFDGRPNSIALSPDARTLAVANTTSLDLIDVATRARFSYPYPGAKGHTGTSASPTGLVWSEDGATLYASTMPTAVQVFSATSRRWLRTIDLGKGPYVKSREGAGYVGSLPAGLALSADGRTLFVAVNIENKIAAVDVASGRFTSSRVTGIAPLAVARRGATLVVVNLGGHLPRAGDTLRTGGFTGTLIPIDPRTGMVGGGTVTLLDATTLAVKGEIQVGRHPNAALFLDDTTLLVTEGNDDAIAVLDLARQEVVKRYPVGLPGDAGWGEEPQALALSADGTRLFVALGGANAVSEYAISPAHDLTFIGALSADWFPGALAAMPDGGVAVANLEGIGSLGVVSNDYPAPDDMPACGRPVSSLGPPALARDAHNFRGSIDFISGAQAAAAGAATTSRAVALARAVGAGFAPVPHVDHVFLIVRENRGYDQVFGDMPAGAGDPRFTNFPRFVTPNTHALAESFVLMDNFYSSGVQSGDGHQWIVEAAATGYIERAFPLWMRSYPKLGDDPLAYAGSGFLWQDALRHGKSVRDYGEFVVTDFSPHSATWSDYWRLYQGLPSRARVVAHSDIPDLQAHIDPRFAGYDTRVPDQVRLAEFLREFHQFERNGNLPNLILMELGDDHTAGFDYGFPKPCSMVAENDQAIGRLVDAISHSRYWKDSLILITEDDSQDGVDHIDGHRQPGLAVGPYVKRHAVVSTLYNQISMVRTAEVALGLPPMNRFDANAAVMSDVFTPTPDLAPFNALHANLALGDMNPKVAQLRGEQRRLAEESARWPIAHIADSAPPGEMAKVIWYATMRY